MFFFFIIIQFLNKKTPHETIFWSFWQLDSRAERDTPH